MKYENIKVGMSVVPHKRSIWGGLDTSCCWTEAKRIGQPYLFVVKIDREVIDLHYEYACTSGDCFLPEDFEPYIKEKNIMIKKSDLNSSMLFKLRGCGLCVLLEVNNNLHKGNTFYNQKRIIKGISGGISSPNDYNENLTLGKWFTDVTNYDPKVWDIIAIKQYESCNEVLHMVINDKYPEKWDWVRQEKTDKNKEIQLENIIEGLSEQIIKAKNELNKIIRL